MRHKLMLVILLVLGTMCVPAQAQGPADWTKIVGKQENTRRIEAGVYAGVQIMATMSSAQVENKRTAAAVTINAENAGVSHHQIDSQERIALTGMAIDLEKTKILVQGAIDLAKAQREAYHPLPPPKPPEINMAGRGGKGPMVIR